MSTQNFFLNAKNNLKYKDYGKLVEITPASSLHFFLINRPITNVLSNVSCKISILSF